MKECRVVYFSLNPDRRGLVVRKLEESLASMKKALFEKDPKEKNDDLLREKNTLKRAMAFLAMKVSILPEFEARSVLDFRQYLSDYQGRLSQLYIILDYVSLVGNNVFEFDQNASIVRELILEYPEVTFSFDEHLPKKYQIAISFVDFLFGHVKDEKVKFCDQSSDAVQFNLQDVRTEIVKDLHSFDPDGSSSQYPLIELCYYKDNLFDASNLRFAAKAKKYQDLVVEKRNFGKSQFSRAKNLALCVEEERSQNLFNSYAIYACGFRSLPVTTASGLKWVNQSKGKLLPNIIIRDYDLQFPDEIGKDSIYFIRGWKYVDHKWKCTLDDSGNDYWSSFYPYGTDNHPPVYYISKGVKGLTVSPEAPQKGKRTTRKKVESLVLPGIDKPISGVYSPFLSLAGLDKNRPAPVEQVYETTRYKASEVIVTRRQDGMHGVPLDIYYTVKSMIDRAQCYYSNNRYIHAAVLARESIELLNGFHEALMLQAYHILAISENAIATNIIGGSEKALREDASFRITKIESEVDRMMEREEENRDEFKYNILNQIFGDCRTFCKNKEHFKAADCFLSAMGHLNEGYTPREILSRLLGRSKRSQECPGERGLNFFGRFWYHIKEFSYVWILIAFILIAALISLHQGWFFAKWIIGPSIVLIILLLLARPLNAVYGLMGTSGSISVFFINLILFCLVFSWIYYFGFFKTAGISYDVNQPHISYSIFADSAATSPKIQLRNLFDKPSLTTTIQQEDMDGGSQETLYIYASDGLTVKDTVVRKVFPSKEYVYQNLDYQTILRNTALTFLMQEPTDLFAAASTYNADMSGKGQTIDKQKTEQFHWILIFQVLVGWIFFGVFISLLYSKFRYES